MHIQTDILRIRNLPAYLHRAPVQLKEPRARALHDTGPGRDTDLAGLGREPVIRLEKMCVQDDPSTGLQKPGNRSSYSTFSSHVVLPYANFVPHLTRSGRCPGTMDK